jgi:hypothetical protein
MPKYKVRNFHFHREIKSDGVKSYQTYEPGAVVELSVEEGDRYKHLIEPVNSKQ